MLTRYTAEKLDTKVGQWIFWSETKTRFVRNIQTMSTYLKHAEVRKFQATTQCDISFDSPLKV